MVQWVKGLGPRLLIWIPSPDGRKRLNPDAFLWFQHKYSTACEAHSTHASKK